MSNSSINFNYALNYLFGAISGATGTIVSHPFFRLKTEKQNEAKITLDNLKNIKWLYSGLNWAMVGYSIEKMLVFGTYNSLRNHDVNPTIAGLTSGVIAAFSVTPFEQLTIDKQRGKINYSLKHLYSGIIPTIIRESVGFGVHFTTYEFFTSKFNPERKVIGTIFCGILSVTCGWCVILPADRIKTQIQSGNFNLKTYNVLKSYSGVHFALMRAIPFHVTCFIVMESLKKEFIK